MLAPAPPFVLLGGVPGAGKSTALQALGEVRADVKTLDSAQQRTWMRRFARRLPYRAYRPLVHAAHLAAVLVAVLRGPARGPLVVHDTATRGWVRAGLAALALRRGWRPALLFLQTPDADALAGQRERGRLVSRASFRRHRARARRVPVVAARESWVDVRLVDRRTALEVMLAVLGDARTPR